LNASVKAYEEKAIATTLLKKQPVAGKIIKETQNNALGTTEIQFSNGTKVILKPTKFKADEIILTAFKKGGLSTYGFEDKASANFSSQIVQQMGFGDFSPVDLRKFLAGKQVSVNTNLSTLVTGMSGSSTIKDLETMLQLVYLNLTAPRKDEGLFNGWKEKQKTSVQFMMADPTTAFIDTVFNTIYQSQPLAPVIIPKSEDFDKINLARVLSIYIDLTTDANDFTFILTGNVDPEAIKPLLSTYIGSLPSKGKPGAYFDNGVRSSNGVHEFNYYKGTEAKSFIFNYYSGALPYTEDLKLKTEVLTEVLNIKIIEELREKIGGIYGGGIFGGVVQSPYSHYNLVLQLPCGPENVDKLKSAANEEIAKIKANGPEQKDLDKVKKTMLEKFKISSQDNRFWGQTLQGIYLDGSSADYILQYEQILNALTIVDIKKTAEILFDGKNEIRAVLYPEKK
jgi:zinc protease